MKRQQRPFSVEIKNPRKQSRPTSLSSARAPEMWTDPFPEDVPERDVYEDLIAEDKGDALREAEKVFSRLMEPTPDSTNAELVQAPEPVGALQEIPAQTELPVPRVLPDLLARSRTEEQLPRADQSVSQRSSRRAGPTTKPRQNEPAPQQAALDLFSEVPSPSESIEAEPLHDPTSPSSPTPPTTGQGRPLRNRRDQSIPPGERWKERRLPRVCWDR